MVRQCFEQWKVIGSERLSYPVADQQRPDHTIFTSEWSDHGVLEAALASCSASFGSRTGRSIS